jgi:uncharacterized protein
LLVQPLNSKIMTNKNNDNTNNTTDNTAKKGFASMPHEKVQEIASKGGHAGDPSKKGFASMPHEKVQEIASKGGQASGGNKGKEEEEEK